MCDLTEYLTSALNNKQGACTNPHVPTISWGFHATVCQKHYDLAVRLFESTGLALTAILDLNGTILPGQVHVQLHAYPATYLADYVKLLALMQNRPVVMDAMQRLSNELNATVVRQRKTKDDLDDRFFTAKKQARGYIRISRALSYYEQLCFFPSSHVVFSGALTTPNFNWALTQGFMPKDPGAGAAHGDFSHRLQWHAVMRIITANFTTPHFGAWSHTPLDLFTSIGNGTAVARNLWGVVFDAQGRPNFSDPSNLLTAIIKNPGLGALHTEIERSANKRLHLEQECNRVFNQVLASPPLAAVKTYLDGRSQTAKPDQPAIANMVNTAYHWKKLGHTTNDPTFRADVPPPVPALLPGGFYAVIPNPSPAYTAWETYFAKLTEFAAREFWNRYILDGETEYGAFLHGSRRTPYLPEQNAGLDVAGVISADDADRASALTIPQRIHAANAGFSTFFTYSEKFGCQKV